MKKILFPLLSALCVLACDPDFLTKAPETKMVTGNFFSSESELALWTNAFYVNQLEGADDLGDMTADDLLREFIPLSGRSRAQAL